VRRRAPSTSCSSAGDGFRERTQLLAAISHDLQIPLTRLRLEEVGDGPPRERLTQDVQAMQILVREGLDLAAPADAGEDWSVVDIDSLLASMAEDAQEFGSPVTFARGRDAPAHQAQCADPLPLQSRRQCRENGGDAELSCCREGPSLIVQVRDHGPGIDPDLIGSMFEPFSRGAPGQPGGRSGTGIGLTIARAQALTFGAAVWLTNGADGGIVARVEISGV